MRVPGKRVKERQFIERGRLVVAVEVDLVYPDFDPDEPCYESETIEFLREVAERAERADLDWLRSHGTVYELIEMK
jgi:hypothetical protein